MSRDGSGNYTRVPGSAYTNGTTADGAELDAEINDIATALTQSLAKDGQTVPTANLPMGGFKHTNVNTASARTEYARASQVQDGAFTYLSSVSGADTITASAPIGLSAYAAGQEFRFVSIGANTGAVTLNINSIGAKPVTKDGATALAAGDIASGAVCVVVYDGTQFQLVSARVVSAASDTVAGVVELATNAEAQTGTDTARAVTPAALASVTATETRAGLVELATTAEAQTGTDAQRAITPASMKSAQIVEQTVTDLSIGAQTEVDFTIPAWAKRVVITGASVSTNGTAYPRIQIGDSGGVETTGYAGASSTIAGTNVNTSSVFSSGFDFFDGGTASSVRHLVVILTRHDATHTWLCEMKSSESNFARVMFGVGSKQLSSSLTTVRFTTTNGTNAFDGGSLNVRCE